MVVAAGRRAGVEGEAGEAAARLPHSSRDQSRKSDNLEGTKEALVSVPEYASSTLIHLTLFFRESVDINLIQIKLPQSELKAETRRLPNISKSPILEVSDDMGSLPLQSASLQVKRIAIIGAGPSGLAVAKYLLAEKFDKIDIYEQQYAFPYFTCLDNILLCLIENN